MAQIALKVVLEFFIIMFNVENKCIVV